jgi:cell division septation protein DedD
MGDIFDEREFRPAEYRPDTELTLGPAVLVSLLLGLLLLCGFCFWKGYSMGTRAAQAAPPASQQPGAQGAAPAAGSAHKPLAAPQSAAQPAVKPALSATATAPAPAQMPTSAQPAFGIQPAGVWEVQIAIVSHQEDADVLVGALRRRGYMVAVRRDPADSMFHVQVGPFASPGDANAMRKRLINDGYNAVVQP